MADQFQHENDAMDATFPEAIYFRNSVVIGNVPDNMPIEHLFTIFRDIHFWKEGGRKVITDIRNRGKKAVILTFDNEEVARLCAFRVTSVLAQTNFTLHAGTSLFHHCLQLDQTCDHRSRMLIMSDFDCSVPREIYLDLFRSFGPVNYFEFCTNGEIPNARIEFARATSALAAELHLQGTMGPETLLMINVPLFPVRPIGPFARSQDSVVPVEESSNTLASFSFNENIEQYFMLWTMNCVLPNERWLNLPVEQADTSDYSRDFVQECMMGAIAFEISRKRIRDKAGRRIPRLIY